MQTTSKGSVFCSFSFSGGGARIEANDLPISQSRLDSFAEKLKRRMRDSHGFGDRRSQMHLHFGKITVEIPSTVREGGVLSSVRYLIGSFPLGVDIQPCFPKRPFQFAFLERPDKSTGRAGPQA